MSGNKKLLREIDAYDLHIAKLRVLALAAENTLECWSKDIYACIHAQGNREAYETMNDIAEAIHWLKEEIFNFPKNSEEDIPESV